MLGRLSIALFLLTALFIGNSARAQNPFYIPFETRPRIIPSQQVKEQWEKLSERQTSCVENALQRENSSIKNMLQKNVAPTSPRISTILANCKAQEDAASVAASHAESKKQIAELTEQLSAAANEIRRLKVEAEELRAKTMEPRLQKSQQEKRVPFAAPGPHKAATDFIYMLGGVVFFILGALFLIGLLAPKVSKRENAPDDART